MQLKREWIIVICGYLSRLWVTEVETFFQFRLTAAGRHFNQGLNKLSLGSATIEKKLGQVTSR